MNDSGNKNLGGGLSLNENPKIPDTSGILNALGGNTTAPTITIGNFIVSSTTNASDQESIEDKLLKARKDTSITG